MHAMKHFGIFAQHSLANVSSRVRVKLKAERNREHGANDRAASLQRREFMDARTTHISNSLFGRPRVCAFILTIAFGAFAQNVQAQPYSYNGADLVVTGTGNADVISLYETNGEIILSFNELDYTITDDYDEIETVVINSGSGDDEIYLHYFGYFEEFDNLVSILIDAGEGDDLVYGSTNYSNTIYGWIGADTLHGGSQEDELHAFDGSKPYDQAADSLNGNGGYDVGTWEPTEGDTAVSVEDNTAY
jgi:hypothetical protein